jgi:TonB family protein
VLRTSVLTVALLAAAAVPAAGQNSEFQSLDSWVAEPGASTTREADVLVVRKGTVRTVRVYSDSVVRFEFRLPTADAEGSVFVRSRFGYGSSPNGERGYRVALTNRAVGKDALGSVSAAGVGMGAVTFSPAPAVRPVGQWQEMELKVERDRLAVSVDGIVLSTSQGLDEFAGYFALQSSRGAAIEFRNLRLQRIPSAGVPFGQGAHRFSEPGMEFPRALKQGKPFYPKEPHDGGIQGTVVLEVVVEATGLVGDIRVVTSVHPDLDEAAIASARQWRFAPGKLSGSPVAVIVPMEVEFALKDPTEAGS